MEDGECGSLEIQERWEIQVQKFAWESWKGGRISGVNDRRIKSFADPMRLDFFLQLDK